MSFDSRQDEKDKVRKLGRVVGRWFDFVYEEERRGEERGERSTGSRVDYSFDILVITKVRIRNCTEPHHTAPLCNEEEPIEETS